MEVAPRRANLRNTLTSPNIRSSKFAKVNKDRRIKLFVECQKACLKSYNHEGQIVTASWDRHPAELGANDTLHKLPLGYGYGFGTPVLKPRAAKPDTTTEAGSDIPSRIEEPLVSRKASSEYIPEYRPTKSTQQVKQTKKPMKELIDDNHQRTLVQKIVAVKTQKRAVSNKRQRPEDADEERDARLAERRERKRTKREVVNPRVLTSSEDEIEDGRSPPQMTRTITRKPDKHKNPKVSAGLALMHGFSATNVGKERLTLKPGPIIGVFNKGKASSKMMIGAKKKSAIHGTLYNIFSEFTFLNKQDSDTRKSRTPQSHELGSETSTPSASPTPKAGRKKGRTSRHDYPKLKNKRLSSRKSACSELVRSPEHASPVLTNKNDCVLQKSTNESEIWDIELCSGTSETSLSLSEETSKTGTVLVDTRAVVWPSAQGNTATQVIIHDIEGSDCTKKISPDPHQGIVTHEIDIAHSNISSITPSQSASHCGHIPANQAAPKSFSRHFFQATPERSKQVVVAPDLGASIRSSPERVNPQIELGTIVDELTPHSVTERPSQALQSALTTVPSIYQASRFDLPWAVNVDIEARNDFEPFLQTTAWSRSSEIAEWDCEANNREPFVDIFCELEAPEFPTGNEPSANMHSDLDTYGPSASYASVYPAMSDCIGDQLHDNEHVYEGNYSQDDYEGTTHGFYDGYTVLQEDVARYEGEGEMTEVELSDENYQEYNMEEEEYQTHNDAYQLSVRDGYEDSIFNFLTAPNRDTDRWPSSESVPEHTMVPSYLFVGETVSSLSDSEEIDMGGQGFTEGRALLMGFQETSSLRLRKKRKGTISRAEADVVKDLRGHWLPQKL